MSALKSNIWRGSTQDDRNPATNQYKGLVTFIADIRQARARELEEKRINKELANIRWAQLDRNYIEVASS